MIALKVNKVSKEILIFVSLLLLLVLITQNINSFYSTKKVLGVETRNDLYEDFWTSFLNDNPNYIPGLIETGKIDKALEIDPNYIINP